jgi:hypothetical protein
MTQKLTYKKLIDIYARKECDILTTEEEFAILMSDLEGDDLAKLNFKFSAKCGHINEGFYGNFRNNPNTDVCKTCNKENRIKKFTSITSNSNMIEYEGYKLCKELLENTFEIYRTPNGCSADIIIKPKNQVENMYLGIQLKVCMKNNFRIYSFKNVNDKRYETYCIVCICLVDKKIWVFNFNDIKHTKNLSIGRKKSQYDNCLIPKEIFSNRCLQFYNNGMLYSKDELFTPITPNMKIEYQYRVRREKELGFLNFVYYDIDNLIFDFTINGSKHQEKVVSCCKNKRDRYNAQIKRSFANKDKKYKKSDNDYYWIWLKDTTLFFVFPEDVMIEQGFIEDQNNQVNGNMYINLNNLDWKSEYMFDLDNLDKDKLLKLLCHSNTDQTIVIPSMLIPDPVIQKEREIKRYSCMDCDTEIGSQSIRCNSCNSIIKRKVERPSKEDLLNILKDNNFVQAGKLYNVSDNAVRKWLRKYGTDPANIMSEKR